MPMFLYHTQENLCVCKSPAAFSKLKGAQWPTPPCFLCMPIFRLANGEDCEVRPK